MERVYAFTDESGNHGFDFNKPDISTYFIITSIIVAESDRGQIELEIERIRKKYFQTGERELVQDIRYILNGFKNVT